jgi:SOS-response transcriptional repressor LexA
MIKTSPTTKLEIKMIPHLGEVGAGSSVPAYDNVYPFMPKSELYPVAVPAHLPASKLGLVTVRGLSLTDFNIFDGDQLVFTRQFNRREIDEDTICIVFIHATQELVAKRIVIGANMLTLKASGGGIADKEYSIDEVEIRGVVIKVEIDVKSQIARARETKARLNGIGRRKKIDELTPRLFTEQRNNSDIPF